MAAVIKQIPTFVNRTYRGGKLLMEYLGMKESVDSFQPEDWISSFSEARNRVHIPNEGISLVDDKAHSLINQVVYSDSFGCGRTEPGVLIKLLDAAERLGIQVHPTQEFAKKVFGTKNGKTESWHILNTREHACIYIGFKEFVTREIWKKLFELQDIPGMLECMHCFEVNVADTILVKAGTPHAIGSGCFLLEVQEPTDYTFRVEKVTVNGEILTPMQIHYGAGEEALLSCFEYNAMTREQAKAAYFIPAKKISEQVTELINYDDTPLFAYSRIEGGIFNLYEENCVTVVALSNGGTLEYEENIMDIRRGDRYFVPAHTRVKISDAKFIVCYPPQE